jgi:hypothetical protein
MGEPPKRRVRRPSNFRQQDLTRAIKAAKNGGLDVVRIDVEPDIPRFQLVMKDGTPATETDVNPFATAPVHDPALRTRKAK